MLTRMTVKINSCLSVIGGTDLDWLYLSEIHLLGSERPTAKLGTLKAESVTMYVRT
jgi:hypothetical protein